MEMEELCEQLLLAENDRLAYVDSAQQAMQLTKPRGGKRAQAGWQDIYIYIYCLDISHTTYSTIYIAI